MAACFQVSISLRRPLSRVLRKSKSSDKLSSSRSSVGKPDGDSVVCSHTLPNRSLHGVSAAPETACVATRWWMSKVGFACRKWLFSDIFLRYSVCSIRTYHYLHIETWLLFRTCQIGVAHSAVLKASRPGFGEWGRISCLFPEYAADVD